MRIIRHEEKHKLKAQTKFQNLPFKNRKKKIRKIIKEKPHNASYKHVWFIIIHVLYVYNASGLKSMKPSMTFFCLFSP